MRLQKTATASTAWARARTPTRSFIKFHVVLSLEALRVPALLRLEGHTLERRVPSSSSRATIQEASQILSHGRATTAQRLPPRRSSANSIRMSLAFGTEGRPRTERPSGSRSPGSRSSHHRRGTPPRRRCSRTIEKTTHDPLNSATGTGDSDSIDEIHLVVVRITGDHRAHRQQVG